MNRKYFNISEIEKEVEVIQDKLLAHHPYVEVVITSSGTEIKETVQVKNKRTSHKD